MSKIYAFLEVKVGGQWQNATLGKANQHRNLEGAAEHVTVPVFYNSKDDALGCLLANTSELACVNPISKARGIPSDVSHTVRQLCKELDESAHHHSWMLASELLNAHRSRSASIQDTGVTDIEHSLTPFIAAMKAELFQQGLCTTDDEFAMNSNKIRTVFFFKN